MKSPTKVWKAFATDFQDDPPKTSPPEITPPEDPPPVEPAPETHPVKDPDIPATPPDLPYPSVPLTPLRPGAV